MTNQQWDRVGEIYRPRPKKDGSGGWIILIVVIVIIALLRAHG